MIKKSDTAPHDIARAWFAGGVDKWQAEILAVGKRFDREYRGEKINLPPEIENLPIFTEWVTGVLSTKISSPFWEIAKPQKNQRCLDIGCGVSFLIYPWREWDAYFYGQEISSVARDALNMRGPQLNSKLFKGVELAPAHLLNYEEKQFDLVIATGFSCYTPLEYWQLVINAVKPILKTDGYFLFDVLNSTATLAEDWAILETYLGAEVYLDSLDNWEKLIKDHGGKINKKHPGQLFQMYKIKFA